MPKLVYTNKKGLIHKTGTGIELGGSLNLTSTETIAAPAAAEAVAASTISVDTNLLFVTNANNANDRIYLPSPTDCPDGHVLIVSATEAFELSSKGDGTTATTINGTAATNAAGEYAAELAVASGVMLICAKIGANAWSAGVLTHGTPN